MIGETTKTNIRCLPGKSVLFYHLLNISMKTVCNIETITRSLLIKAVTKAG